MSNQIEGLATGDSYAISKSLEGYKKLWMAVIEQAIRDVVKIDDKAERIHSEEYRYLTENSKGFQLACMGAGFEPYALASRMKTHLTEQKDFLSFRAKLRSKHQKKAA